MKPLFKSSIIFVLFLIINFSFGQKKLKIIKNFNQKELFAFKVNSNKYNFWSYKNRFFPKSDTLSYFVDDRAYKGILNYGIEFSSIDKTPLNFFENLNMYHLKLVITDCVYNPNDSIINIQGTITGGWYGKDWKDVKNGVGIFIGEKKDTVSALYYENRTNPNKTNVLYKGNTVGEFEVLDTFPSFYFKKYVYNKTNYGDERTFKIKSKINKNSILAFGLSYTYSEIFEIGKLVFSNEKRKIPKELNLEENNFIPIIVNNERYQNIVKPQMELTLKKSNDFDYYKITQKAEDYIIENNFKKAKNYIMSF